MCLQKFLCSVKRKSISLTNRCFFDINFLDPLNLNDFHPPMQKTMALATGNVLPGMGTLPAIGLHSSGDFADRRMSHRSLDVGGPGF